MSDASDSTTAEVVGRNLLRILGEQNMAQAELARRLDLTPSTINLYIRGAINMSVTTLTQIADILGCEPCRLLKDEAAV